MPHTSLSRSIFSTGGDEDEHLKSLEEVLKRLQEAGLQVKKHKCQFLAPSVSYLGHVIDSSGLHPEPEKVEAIKSAPTPKNVSLCGKGLFLQCCQH